MGMNAAGGGGIEAVELFGGHRCEAQIGNPASAALAGILGNVVSLATSRTERRRMVASAPTAKQTTHEMNICANESVECSEVSPLSKSTVGIVW